MKRSKGLIKIKVEYNVTVHSVSGVPKSAVGAGNELFIECKRGKKPENHFTTKKVSAETKDVTFSQKVTLFCTMVKDEKTQKFKDKKHMSFLLKLSNAKLKKPEELGKGQINLVDFADPGVRHESVALGKEKGAPQLMLKLESIVLKYDGKKLVKPGTGTAGAQKVKLGGIDYELATADEQSEAGSDSDEASDFPDEDPEEPAAKSSTKTKDSKSSDKKPESAPAKPSASAAAPSSSSSSSEQQQQQTRDELEAELKDLRRDKERMQKKLDRLEASKAENGVSAEAKDKLEAQVAELKAENAQLQQRLQDANASLAAATIAAVSGGSKDQAAEPAVDPVEFDDLKRDKARLERKIERLTKDLEEAKQKATRSSTPTPPPADSAATKALEEKVATLEGKLAAELKEKDELRASVDKLKKSDKEWQEKEKKWKSDLAAAKNEAAEKVAAAELLQVQLAGADSERSRLKAQIAELEDQALENERKAAAAAKKHESLQAELSALQQSLAEKQQNGQAGAELAAAQSRIASLQADLEASERRSLEAEEQARSRVAAVRADLDNLTAQLAETEKSAALVPSLERKQAALEEEIARLQTELSEQAETTAALDRSRAEVGDLNSRIEELRAKLTESEERASAAASLKKHQNKLEARIADLEAEIAERDAQGTEGSSLEGGKEELAAMRKERSLLQANVAELRSQLDEAAEEKAAEAGLLRSKLAAAGEEAERLRELLDEADRADGMRRERQEKLEAELSRLKTELESAKKRTDEDDGDLSARMAQLEEVHRAEKAIWDTERGELQSNLEAKQAEVDDLEDKVRKLKDEKKKLSKELDALKSGKSAGKAGTGDDESQRLRDQVDELTTQLDESKTAAEKAKKELSQRDKEIKQLKQRIEELQQAADSASSKSSDGGEKLARLKEKLAEAREEADASRRELDQLREELEAARSQGSKASASLTVKAGKSKAGDAPLDASQLQQQVARLERTVAQMKLIEATVYGAEPEYEGDSGFPTAVSLISSTLDEWGSLANKENEELLPRFLHALKNSFTRSAYDSEMLAYWLSFACGAFAKFLKALPDDAAFDEDTFFERDILEQESKESLAEMEPLPKFFYGLAFVTFDIYSVLLINIYNQLDQILTGFVLQQSKNSVQLEQFPAILQNVLGLLRKNYIGEKIIDLFMNQVFYFVDAQLFNALLNAPQLFTANAGFQIKIALSQVENTLNKTDKHLSSMANNAFGHIREAANLLAMDKSLVADEETIGAVFSNLNVVQIKHIVDRFKPDEVAPMPVDKSVKRSLEELCLKAKNSRLALELEAMKINKINLLAELE